MTTEAAAPAPTPGLTAEEAAALSYNDDLSEDPNEPATDQNAAANAGADPAGADAANGGDDGKPADDPAAAAPEAGAAQPAAGAEANEPAAAPAPEPVAVTPQAPLLVAVAPDDAKEQLEAIAAKKEALAIEFDAGDVTGVEFQKRLDAFNKEERAIETVVNNAELAANMEKQRAQSAWNADCDAFFSKPENKAYTDKPDLFTQINENIRVIATLPRNRNITGAQLLEKAHKMLEAELGHAIASGPAAAAKPAAAKLPPPRAALPPNIGDLPAADITNATGGKWDSLDRLATSDPLAYEKKIASMSEADRDAYNRA